MALTVEDMLHLLATRGQQQYGRETVSQLDHALQCAALADAAGEDAPTIVAALLHDLGHLIAAEREARADDDQQGDDLHQFIALPFLRGVMPDAVIEPVHLHVEAKRYLCATDPTYFAGLSPASVRSLALQGGPHDADAAAAFMRRPYAAEALRVRRYDDLAKEPGRVVPGLGHYAAMLARVAGGG